MPRSLGQLTIDLIAKVGGFEVGMDKAAKKAKGTANEIEKTLNRVAKSASAIGTAAIATLGAMTTNLANSAREIQNLSRVANTSTADFQKITFAAQRYGVEQDKVADILKDTSDKIGDFLQTGGGPLADFFENIAPQIGVTAEQFADLSGQDALQLYVKSLEKANLSQSEMTFFMEAIASDATLLLPLLRDNGKELGRLGDEAERTGNVLNDMDFEQLRQISESTDQLQAQFKGMSNEIVLSAIPAINDLTDLLGDESTVEAAKTLGTAIVTSINAAVQAVKGVIEITQFLGEELAAITNGAAADDIVRLEQQLEKVKEIRDTIAFSGERVRFFGKNGVIEYWSDDELDAEMARLEKALKTARDNMEVTFRDAPVIDEVVVPDITGAGGSGGGRPIRPPPKKKDYSVSFDPIFDPELARVAADERGRVIIDAQEREVLALQDSFRAQEDVIKDAYDKQRQLVLDSTILTKEEEIQLLKNLEDRKNEELLEVNGTYWEKWLAAAEENLTSFDELSANVLEGFADRFGDEVEKMVFDAQNLRDAVQGLAEGMARTIVNALGEMAAQWLTYQAVQLATGQTTQAAAVASSVASAGVISAAYATPAALASLATLGTNAGPAAAAISGTVALSESLALSGMAHDGIDKVPQTGTWLLEKGERVTTAETSAKLDNTLARVQADLRGNDSSESQRPINLNPVLVLSEQQKRELAQSRQMRNEMIKVMKEEQGVLRNAGNRF